MFARYLFTIFLLNYLTVVTQAEDAPVRPIHLDDIHYITSDEVETIGFFKEKLLACEMAQPSRPLDFIRFLSVRENDPSLTVNSAPYSTERDAARANSWRFKRLVPRQPDSGIYWGVYWVAFGHANLDSARQSFPEDAIRNIQLPHAPSLTALQVNGPDNLPIVLVERPQSGPAFHIDHLMLLVSDVDETTQFFSQIFEAKVLETSDRMAILQVADATLVLTEPATLGIDRKRMIPRPKSVFGPLKDGKQTLTEVLGSVDHLGFLYQDIEKLVTQAQDRGYNPLYPPFSYNYAGQKSPYAVTAFTAPDGFNIEAVQPAGRIGPHVYYRELCPRNSIDPDARYALSD